MMARSRIPDLLMTVFSGNKDEYGKEEVPPLPLGFDRVMEGRAISSDAQLLQLPVEILGVLLQYLTSESLSALALVNRDCCQLARSRQFANVRLDYGDSSMALVMKLMEEALERHRNNDYTLSPSIGACIRRITVATDPQMVTQRHGVSLGESSLDLEIRRKIMAVADKFYSSIYLAPLISILSDRNAAPHLELVDWEDRIVLPQTFFRSLVTCHAKHVKLYRVAVEEQFELSLAESLKTRGWPLRTLHLEILPDIWNVDKITVYPLCYSILRLCAPTLESLTWDLVDDNDVPLPENLGQAPQFTRLRKLQLGQLRRVDFPMLEALVCDGLRELGVDINTSPVYTAFFQQRGLIRSLEKLHWTNPGETRLESWEVQFLRANRQLQHLSFSFAIPIEELEFQLLPLLAASFTHLKSLSVQWQSTSISKRALGAISNIKSLEQISLSAGEQFGWKHDWLINHQDMREYLSRLPLLRKLAFSRDTYDKHIPGAQVGKYYMVPHMSDSEYREMYEFDTRWKAWEHFHLQHILREADAYLGVMPQLEWVYFGQIPMMVMDDPKTGKKRAKALSGRDDCSTLLRRMFGGDPE